MRNAPCLTLGIALLSCGPQPKPATTGPKPTTTVDADADFGPLEIGADYETYTKVTKFPHFSQTHGQRFVEIWVNQVGVDAYTGEAEFPAGTTIVKTSWERDGDKPSDIPGPIFVMHKKAAGYSAEHEDWYYAIHWAEPTAKMRKRFGGPIYWRSPSSKVDYCWKCHENYDREIGLPPKEARAWEEPATE